MFDVNDWQLVFLPSVLKLLAGEPFNPDFFNPPWALFPLIPFALVPYKVGRILLLLAGLVSYLLLVRKLGANLLAFAVFVLSVPTFDSIAWGNIEWLALLGFVMPQPIGLIFLAIKPQVSVGIVIFWFFMAFKASGVMGVLRLSLPTLLVTILSIVFFGAWFTHTLTYSPAATLNLSLFPISVPVGLGLLVAAIRKGDIRYAIASSPCFFPVVSPQVWLVVFLALTPNLVELGVTSLALWVIGLMR